MILQGDTTINSEGQTFAAFGAPGSLSFAGTGARLQITLVGAAGGNGGNDNRTSGGSAGSAGRVDATVRVEDETLTVNRVVPAPEGKMRAKTTVVAAQNRAVPEALVHLGTLVVGAVMPVIPEDPVPVAAVALQPSCA